MKKYLRLLQILKIAAKYRLQELLEDFNLGTPVSLLFKLPFSSDKKLAKLTRGMRLRLALEELGPIFIKFGQLLSTRRDMLPLDLADELSQTSRSSCSFRMLKHKTIIEQHLGR